MECMINPILVGMVILHIQHAVVVDIINDIYSHGDLVHIDFSFWRQVVEITNAFKKFLFIICHVTAKSKAIDLSWHYVCLFHQWVQCILSFLSTTNVNFFPV